MSTLSEIVKKIRPRSWCRVLRVGSLLPDRRSRFDCENDLSTVNFLLPSSNTIKNISAADSS